MPDFVTIVTAIKYVFWNMSFYSKMCNDSGSCATTKCPANLTILYYSYTILSHEVCTTIYT